MAKKTDGMVGNKLLLPVSTQEKHLGIIVDYSIKTVFNYVVFEYIVAPMLDRTRNSKGKQQYDLLCTELWLLENQIKLKLLVSQKKKKGSWA